MIINNLKIINRFFSKQLLIEPNLEKREKLLKYHESNKTSKNGFVLKATKILNTLFYYIFYGKFNYNQINKKIIFIFENERFYLTTWSNPIGLDWKKYTDSLNKEIKNLE